MTGVRDTGLLHPWSFCLSTILLLAPGCLAPKGAAGSKAGSGATRGTGIDDTRPNGLVTGVGRGAGVAGQPGTQNHQLVSMRGILKISKKEWAQPKLTWA